MKLKRLIALLLIFAMAFLLTGCGASEDALESATPPPIEETVEPEPTPAPTPVPTPVPIVEVKDYKFEKFSNQSLALGLHYPTHWINEPGRHTIAFVEPVNENEVGARMAVTVKALEKRANTAAIKEQFESYLDTLARQFDDFVLSGEVSSNIKFIKRKAYSTTYTATIEGTPIQGFAIITYVSKEKLIYVFHFYAPQDRYEELTPVMQQLEKNVITFA